MNAAMDKNPMNTPDRFSPGRRKFLIGSAAGALVLGAVGTVSWSRLANHRAQWIERVVRKNLPGVTIDESSLVTFVQDILDGELIKPSRRKASVFAEQAIPWLTAHVPKLRVGLQTMERQVLTAYLLGSNFFRVPDPKRETIAYYGHAVACANPFVEMS